LDEIGVDVAAQMSSVPNKALPSAATKQSEKESDDLLARLESLRQV